MRDGGLVGIRRVHEGGRHCVEVLDRLAVAHAGIAATSLLILERHVDGCVRTDIDGGGGSEHEAELLTAIRRFVRSV